MTSPTLAERSFPSDTASEHIRAMMLESLVLFRAESYPNISLSVVAIQHKRRKRRIHSRDHQHLLFDSPRAHPYTSPIHQLCNLILHRWGCAIATHSCYENPIHPSPLSNPSLKKNCAMHASGPLSYVVPAKDVVPFSPTPHFFSH